MRDCKVIAAIRRVAATIRDEIDAGRQSTQIDAWDVVEILLAIGDELEQANAEEQCLS
jgi:uncharacterized protein (UPF0147 family)